MRSSPVAEPAAAQAPPRPAAASTPAGAKPAASAGPKPAEVTKEIVVAQAMVTDSHRTLDILKFGKLACDWVRRQPDRAQAVREIRQAMEAQGLRGDVLNVNRQIRAYALYDASDGKTIKSLGLSVVYALLPLVRRDSRTDVWTIRAGVEKQADELVARAAADRLSAVRVSQEVAAFFPAQEAAGQEGAAPGGQDPQAD